MIERASPQGARRIALPQSMAYPCRSCHTLSQSPLVCSSGHQGASASANGRHKESYNKTTQARELAHSNLQLTAQCEEKEPERQDLILRGGPELPPGSSHTGACHAPHGTYQRPHADLLHYRCCSCRASARSLPLQCFTAVSAAEEVLPIVLRSCACRPAVFQSSVSKTDAHFASGQCQCCVQVHAAEL